MMKTRKQVTRWVWCDVTGQHEALFRCELGGTVSLSTSSFLLGRDTIRPIPPPGEDGPEHPPLPEISDPDEWRTEGYSADHRWTLRSWRSEGGWIAYVTVYGAHGTRHWSCHGVSRGTAARALWDRCGLSLPGSAERVLRAWASEEGP
jgi:hypothetical protein